MPFPGADWRAEHQAGCGHNEGMEDADMDPSKRHIVRLDDGREIAVGSDGRPWQIYASGPAIPPPHLGGREEETRHLEDAVWEMMGRAEGGQPILLFGPRGVGKTVLLKEFQNNPPCNADVRITTPATGLADINNIPNILLSTPGSWKDKIPARGEFKFSLPHIAGLEFGWDIENSATAEGIRWEIIKKCSIRPMVLIVDEAHTLKEGPGTFFLNYMQDIATDGRLLLVLAGTPNLRSALIATRASFISRGDDCVVGALDDQGARDSIEIPLKNQCPPVTIQPDVLEKVVEDSSGYPFFLQAWGEELWTRRREESSDLIDMHTYNVSRDVVQKRKDNHYGGYFSEIKKDGLTRHARLMAETFIEHRLAEGTSIMPYAKALEKIFSMMPTSLNKKEREDESIAIIEELKSHDVLWSSGEGFVRPALPCFHHFIKDMAAEIIGAYHGVEYSEEHDSGADGKGRDGGR